MKIQKSDTLKGAFCFFPQCKEKSYKTEEQALLCAKDHEFYLFSCEDIAKKATMFNENQAQNKNKLQEKLEVMKSALLKIQCYLDEAFFLQELPLTLEKDIKQASIQIMQNLKLKEEYPLDSSKSDRRRSLIFNNKMQYMTNIVIEMEDVERETKSFVNELLTVYNDTLSAADELHFSKQDYPYKIVEKKSEKIVINQLSHKSPQSQISQKKLPEVLSLLPKKKNQIQSQFPLLSYLNIQKENDLIEFPKMNNKTSYSSIHTSQGFSSLSLQQVSNDFKQATSQTSEISNMMEIKPNMVSQFEELKNNLIPHSLQNSNKSKNAQKPSRLPILKSPSKVNKKSIQKPPKFKVKKERKPAFRPQREYQYIQKIKPEYFDDDYEYDDDDEDDFQFFHSDLGKYFGEGRYYRD